MGDSIGHTKKATVKALEQSLGVVSVACRAVGISRDTHYRWLKEDEGYKAEVEALAEVALDFAESSLHKLIQDGCTLGYYLLPQDQRQAARICRDARHTRYGPSGRRSPVV